MSASLAQIEADAMKLSEVERTVLAEHLVDSLQVSTLTETELAWVEEADRRYSEYTSGQRGVLRHDEFFSSIREARGWQK